MYQQRRNSSGNCGRTELRFGPRRSAPAQLCCGERETGLRPVLSAQVPHQRSHRSWPVAWTSLTRRCTARRATSRPGGLRGSGAPPAVPVSLVSLTPSVQRWRGCRPGRGLRSGRGHGLRRRRAARVWGFGFQPACSPKLTRPSPAAEVGYYIAAADVWLSLPPGRASERRVERAGPCLPASLLRTTPHPLCSALRSAASLRALAARVPLLDAHAEGISEQLEELRARFRVRRRRRRSLPRARAAPLSWPPHARARAAASHRLRPRSLEWRRRTPPGAAARRACSGRLAWLATQPRRPRGRAAGT